MGYFFFDESIHERGGFALGAFVYTEIDPQAKLKEALKEAGLSPGSEEFKSSAYFSRDPRQAKARDHLKVVLSELGTIALMVIPADQKDALGSEALICLRSILDTNGLMQEHHQVYLDQGLFPTKQRAHYVAQDLGLQIGCSLYPESDSKAILGLQLADLVAHTASIMLLAQQGIVCKTLKAVDVGYDADSDVDIALGFILWTEIRYKFFCVDPPPIDTWRSQLDFQAKVEPYGLYVSPLCGDPLAAAARERFAYMYLGCTS